MANDQIKDFFRQKNAAATSSGIDWSAKRESWIRAVDDLYRTISSDYLSSVERDLVQVDTTRMKTVQEQYIGTYQVPEMTLAVGGEEVLFSPRGVNVIGSAGRVDVYGEKGEATLVRQSDDVWSLVIARTPKLQLVPLSDQSFLEMLRGVMR